MKSCLFLCRSCALCTGVQNRLEDFAREHSDKLYLAVADFDKKPELKEVFGIDKLPTVRTFYKGEMMDEFKGPVWPSIKYVASKLLKVK
jgi:thioredoxin-like negative regulator of GroEL